MDDNFCKCGAVLAVDGLCSASDLPPKKCPLINIDDVDNVGPTETEETE